MSGLMTDRVGQLIVDALTSVIAKMPTLSSGRQPVAIQSPLGQAAAAASIPVVLATEQSAAATPLYTRLSDGTAALPTTAAHVLRTAAFDKTTTYVTVFSGTSPAAAGHAESTAITGLSVFSAITIYALLAGATGGVLDVVLETSDGTHWVEYARFPTITAAASAVMYTLDPVLTGVISAAGSGLTTTFVLAANSFRGGHWGDTMRARLVAGSGTSAGSAQSIIIAGVRDTA
jgi:hypothetical protein